MAPEVFKHRKYDKKVDVFSFAMILYEVIVVLFSIKTTKGVFKAGCNSLYSSLQMLEGEPPFSDFEPYEAAKYVAEGHRPPFRSKGFNISDLRE
jgi:serine/threonine protein kinase